MSDVPRNTHARGSLTARQQATLGVAARSHLPRGNGAAGCGAWRVLTRCDVGGRKPVPITADSARRSAVLQYYSPSSRATPCGGTPPSPTTSAACVFRERRPFALGDGLMFLHAGQGDALHRGGDGQPTRPSSQWLSGAPGRSFHRRRRRRRRPLSTSWPRDWPNTPTANDRRPSCETLTSPFAEPPHKRPRGPPAPGGLGRRPRHLARWQVPERQAGRGSRGSLRRESSSRTSSTATARS